MAPPPFAHAPARSGALRQRAWAAASVAAARGLPQAAAGCRGLRRTPSNKPTIPPPRPLPPFSTQVHVTADGECVVFHDFLVPLRLGTEVVRLPVSALTADQLKSPDFTQWMLSPK